MAAATLTAAMCASFSLCLPRTFFRAPLALLEQYFLGGKSISPLQTKAPLNPTSSSPKTIGFCMAAEAEIEEQSSWAGSEEQSPGTPMTDLLSRFSVSVCSDPVLIDGASEEELEISLSLRGWFEAEPEKNQVVGVLSISGLSRHNDEGDDQPIVKTYSYPMESEEEEEEEEVRKRKGLQSLKRLEMKRRRFEKRESRAGDKHASYRGVVGSQGPSGSSSGKEVKTTSLSIPLSLNQANIIANPIISMEEDKQLNKANELERSRLEGKLCVSAQGDGPNGRMIQGLLYKYGNEVDVRIVCVCHGSFLTPTEFVKHAGGGDVAHPLQHIVVSCWSPFIY